MGLNGHCVPVMPVMDSGCVDRKLPRIKTEENMKGWLVVTSAVAAPRSTDSDKHGSVDPARKMTDIGFSSEDGAW